MNFSVRVLAVIFVSSFAASVGAQSTEAPPRHLTLDEAVQLALNHNHDVRIAGLEVQEEQRAKEVARSDYFPHVTNDSRIFTVTQTQFVQFPEGSFGTVAGSPIPARPITINQGGKTFVTSGTMLSEPLTQLLTKIKPANDAAQADLNASRSDAKETENEVALKVRQIYYQVLITQLQQDAAQAKIRADEDVESERVQQVKYGSALNEQLIEGRADTLEAKQDLLTTELQISDLTMQLNDAMGLPVTTKLDLDTSVPPVQDTCERQDCVKIALASHPEIVAARAEVKKASAGVHLAKADYFPDISAFARYSYASDVPFLARNFGTFGAEFTWDLFDGGRRRAALRESDDKLAQAQENLARVTDDVELRVETALNQLDRTREMVQVSQQVLSLRTESNRVTTQQFSRGEALRSQADATLAQQFQARTILLQSQLDYAQAHDELLQAMGLTPQ